MATDHQH